MKKLAGIVLGLALFASPVFADRPHVDYTTKTNTATGSGAATAVTLWTPASGTGFVLQGVMISANNASITMRLQVSGTDVIPPIRFESTGQIVIEAGGAPLYTSIRDAVLTYTVTGSGAWSILAWGYEAVDLVN